jgi:ABC-type glutathione transport system ATPase component
MMTFANQIGKADVILAGIVTIGIIGYALVWAITLVEKKQWSGARQGAKSMIEFQNVSKEFRNIDGTVTRALNGVSFSMRKGEFVCVVGPSGCGKTTLLQTLCYLLKPVRGEISFKGERILQGELKNRSSIWREGF